MKGLLSLNLLIKGCNGNHVKAELGANSRPVFYGAAVGKSFDQMKPVVDQQAAKK